MVGLSLTDRSEQTAPRWVAGLFLSPVALVQDLLQLALTRLAQRGPFPIASAWSPHKEVFKANVPLACGKREAAPQAGNFAVSHVASIDCDDLIFRLAGWAAEGD